MVDLDTVYILYSALPKEGKKRSSLKYFIGPLFTLITAMALF